jgi:hypothetical protein
MTELVLDKSTTNTRCKLVTKTGVFAKRKPEFLNSCSARAPQSGSRINSGCRPLAQYPPQVSQNPVSGDPEADRLLELDQHTHVRGN